MITDKRLRIVSTRREGSLAERCREVLERTGRGGIILEMTFFIEAYDLGTFDESERTILDECRSWFGIAVPQVTCVAQKPVGVTLTAEVLYMTGDGEVERSEDYLIIRNGADRELVTKGIRFPDAGDTGAQAKAVFSRIEAILQSEGFKINEIVRQWNYIEGITEVNDGLQNYQLFNDARTAFYSETDWPDGYPAATGIGCSAGGVTVAVHAVRNAAKHSRPIDNPLQTPAHKYSGKVLEAGREALKSTPKFERGRLLGDTVLISGTAAIKGEVSEISSDPAIQSEAAAEVVESLVSPGNIFPENNRFRFNSLRVYIKREEDAGAIVRTLEKRWKGVPKHYLIADICRRELLLEVEGFGTTRRFLECCCVDDGEAVQAQAGGALRVELCENLPIGGVTPSIENIKKTLSAVDIPVNVLVRPRGGDFVFSEEEVSRMIESIKACREVGANGVVIGALREDGSVDVGTMSRLIEAAEGMEITFHRAFDECAEPFGALEDVISLGCDRLLTAGHAANVNDGASTLKNLVEKAAGRIIIMAGSGVRPGNIVSLESSTGVKEFHSSSHGPDGRTDRRVVSEMIHS